MKILQICNKIPYPPKDGGAIATFNLSIGFVEHAHDVTILAMNTSKHYFDVSMIPEPIKNQISFIDVEVNTDIKLLGALKNLIFSKLPYNAERFVFEKFKMALEELLKTNSYDVIQLEGLYLTPYIPIIRKYSEALIAYRAHNIEHEIWQRTATYEKNFLKRIYLNILTNRIKRMELKVLNTYDVLIPITLRDEKILNSFGNIKQTHVSPTGFEMQNLDSKENIEVEYPSLFHIGALDWTPNQEGLLWFINNCWENIRKNNPTLKFYIAGRNAPQWFINQIKKQNIVFCGEVSDAKQFIKSKAIMIVPLLSGSGMRIKIIEGMALGKAIISTSIGTEGIPTTDGENIYVADKPDGFINAINILAKDNSKIKEIGTKAKMLISEKFDNFAIAKSLLDFYQICCKRTK